jgi:uncharacterized protein (TIGR03086 family)
MDELSSAESALTAALKVVHGLGDSDLGRRTPCTDYDVAALADHLVDTIIRLSAAAGIDAPAPHGTIEERIRLSSHTALDAWRRRGLTGEVTFAGRTLPARQVLGVLSLELVVHGWDFADATRRTLEVSDAHAAFVLGLACHTLTPQSRISAGFDDPVALPAASGALHRLVAFTGRKPLGSNDRTDAEYC